MRKFFFLKKKFICFIRNQIDFWIKKFGNPLYKFLRNFTTLFLEFLGTDEKIRYQLSTQCFQNSKL